MKKPLALSALSLLLASTAMAGTYPTPPNYVYAYTQGAFAYPITWPIIPLHVSILPDGRVLSYGTDQNGYQGAGQVYDVWNPIGGQHLTLPNMTQTDLFCSAGTLMLNGQELITGGDKLTATGERGGSNAQVETFNPTGNTLTAAGAMTYARWYPSTIATKNGDVVVLGGRQEQNVDAPTPEVYNPATGWRLLTGATSIPAYGFPDGNWYYPKAFVQPSGNILVLGNWTRSWVVNPTGNGSVALFSEDGAYPGDYKLPALTYAPGKAMSLRQNKKVNLLDLNTGAFTLTADVDQVRYWANLTVLADGKVMLNGGAEVDNLLEGVSHSNAIWNPATGTWTKGAWAQAPRLYHSTALLLPDASVLTAGGGAPGPVSNMNAELYYPPYLYNTNGTPAARPVISTAPAVAALGSKLTVTMGDTSTIAKVTLVRVGATTHAFNPDQRFIPVTFTQAGKVLTVQAPTDPNSAIPGYYFVFAFKGAVPSIAKIVKITL